MRYGYESNDNEDDQLYPSLEFEDQTARGYRTMNAAVTETMKYIETDNNVYNSILKISKK